MKQFSSYFRLTAILATCIFIIGAVISSPPAAAGYQPYPPPTTVSDAADLDSQSPYLVVYPGEQIRPWISVLNSGNTTWTPEDYGYTGTGQWSARSGNLWRAVVPGATILFEPNWTEYAPETPGRYSYGFILNHNGVGFGPHFFIDVEVIPRPVDAADLDSQSPYLVVYPGEQIRPWISVLNSGNTTWTPEDYGYTGTGQWSARSGNLWRAVVPGATILFEPNWTEYAPETPGRYSYGFILNHDGVGFGPHFFIDVEVIPRPASEEPTTEPVPPEEPAPTPEVRTVQVQLNYPLTDLPFQKRCTSATLIVDGIEYAGSYENPDTPSDWSCTTVYFYYVPVVQGLPYQVTVEGEVMTGVWQPYRGETSGAIRLPWFPWQDIVLHVDMKPA